MFGLSSAKNAGKRWSEKAAAVIRRTSYAIEQIIRIVSMQFVLAPAAYVLPKKWASALANALGLLLVILPIPGVHTYWQMRRAFGRSRIDSFFLSWGWLARPLSDYVVLKRCIYKRENIFNWKIVERNVDGINSLRSTDKSYIVAIAHFPKKPSLGIHFPSISPGHNVQLADAVITNVKSLYDLRVRIQYGALLKAFSCCLRDCETVFNKDLGTAITLHRRLREKGNVVFIPIDGGWQKTITGSFERPFAGQRKRIFSTGAAQLARLAKCPIIGCVAIEEKDGTIALEWGSPIRFDSSNEAGDIDVMNELLDKIEVTIGERPTQYIFEIGGDRQWNSEMRRWEDLGN